MDAYCFSFCQLLWMPAGRIELNWNCELGCHLFYTYVYEFQVFGEMELLVKCSEVRLLYRSDLRTAVFPWLAVWFPLLKAGRSQYPRILCFTWERGFVCTFKIWICLIKGFSLPPENILSCPPGVPCLSLCPVRMHIEGLSCATPSSSLYTEATIWVPKVFSPEQPPACRYSRRYVEML